MTRTALGFAAMAAIVAISSGCSNPKYAEGERQVRMPINCGTAEGDIRLLQHEKAHVADQVTAGITSITPAGAILGVATGTEGEKLKVTSGEYNRMIDRRIAEIRSECGLN